VKADSLLADTWTALMALAAEHARDLADETPVQRFLSLLRDGFASRRIYLTAPHGDVPEHATAWGWEISRRADGSGEGEFRHAPQAILIGMLEADWVWLIPDTTYGFLVQAEHVANRVFPVELKTLLRHLDEAHLIQTQKDRNATRRTVEVRVGATTRRVIKLARSALESPTVAETGNSGNSGNIQDLPRADGADVSDVSGATTLKGTDWECEP